MRLLHLLPRTVIILGLVSFFNDLASEMVVPLLPLLLSGMNAAAAPILLGAMEGIADAMAALLKLWSGRYSDILGGKRKGLAVAGYTLSNAARPLLGLAASWPILISLRAVDRMGKGIRSAPRDALVADATPAPSRGLAYGFHRALDNAGAVGGSLIAAAILSWTLINPRALILWSVIPGCVAVLLLIVFVPRAARSAAPKISLPPLRWFSLAPRLRRYLLVLGLFTFSRVSETFLILRGHELGMSVVSLLLLWAALNFSKALTSTLGGQIADRWPRTRLIALGWLGLALGFAALALATLAQHLWWISVAYGLIAGLAEGPERALISDFSQGQTRGTAFGWYHLLTGAAAIPAGLIFGALWHVFGAAWAFAYGAVVAVLALLLLTRWVR